MIKFSASLAREDHSILREKEKEREMERGKERLNLVQLSLVVFSWKKTTEKKILCEKCLNVRELAFSRRGIYNTAVYGTRFLQRSNVQKQYYIIISSS